MKIKLVFHVLAVVSVADYSFAKNEINRRRPTIDSAAQDSDGHFFDQIASDSINHHQSTNIVTVPENYAFRYHAATDDFRKSSTKKAPAEPKVHYVTPEPYNRNFSKEYVHHALKTNEKSKEKIPSSSFFDYSSLTRDVSQKTSTEKRRKVPNFEPEDYNYYFPESKRIHSRTTSKPTTSKVVTEKFFKPQSPGAIITKDSQTSGGDTVNSYHYYYPEESSSDVKGQKSSFNYAPSTYSPSTIKPSKVKFSSKKKTPTIQLENTSTDSYQYQPVLQRPSQYTPTENVQQDFIPAYSTYEGKNYGTYSTPAPSKSSPIKMLKPTKKNNFYLPSSTVSPFSTTRSQKIRRPSTEAPYQDLKQFSVSPSPSTIQHFSTTRAPDVFKYSSPASVSSTTRGSFYIKPSTHFSSTPSTIDLESHGSDDQMVVIQPKTQFINYESHENSEPIQETIIYKFVPEETPSFESNKTSFYSTRATFPETIESSNYQPLNQTTLADMDFYNDFHKNYNYEYFTEQDAGPMNASENDETMKMDHMIDSETVDDKQRASKKNMMFSIDPETNEYVPSGMMSLEDHEMPPPGGTDHNAEASKNQYFVLYTMDEEEKRQRKHRKKHKPEPEVVYHHHHHEHDKNEEFPQFDSEFDSEFDSDLSSNDHVRIVDPAVRGGRPIEFTKDDYLRHIKQAVVQYMKDYQKEPSASGSNGKLKNQRYQETVHEIRETPHRPTKIPSAATTASSYKYSLPPHQYKSLAPLKLPKNTYSTSRLKDAIEDLQDSPQVDLTVKKNKQKPFDLSAIDVGQSYQHVSHFDHSAALKNVEEFDQSNVVGHQQTKPKLHFSQKAYHDINNLGYSHKPIYQNDDSENESPSYKSYVLPSKYNFKGNQGGASSYSTVNFESSKLPRIVSHHEQVSGQDDDDEDENKVEDPVDAPIQIINGIPVANPYNIDLNTLKYMLGGIAQAEVNDQLKDLDDSSSSNQKYPTSWKAYSPSQLGSYTSNTPTYQVFGQNDNSQRQKKNSAQSGSHGNQQTKYTHAGSLTSFNKGKNQSSNKNKNTNSGQKNSQSFAISDFNGWNQMNKKLRTEASSTNSRFVIRPVNKNKHSRDEHLHQKSSINRGRYQKLSTDMRPPPPLKQKTHLRVTKLL